MYVSHSPEQLSSPPISLSPLASHSSKRVSCDLLSANPLAAACDAGLVPSFYGNTPGQDLAREAPIAALLAKGLPNGVGQIVSPDMLHRGSDR